MNSVPRPNLRKIPGNLMPIANKDIHVKDLTKLNRVELLEIKDREEAILTYEIRMNLLPDKGKRVKDFYDKILAELQRRSDADEAAALLSELNIASKGIDKMNKIEWSGNLTDADVLDDVIDSDDEDDEDPLRILAQRTMHVRRVKVLPPEPSLITDKDLEEIKSFENDSPDSGVLDEDENVLSTSSTITETEKVDTVVNAELISIDLSKSLPKIKSKLQEISTKGCAKNNSSKTNDQNGKTIEPHLRYIVEKTESVVPQREKFKPYKTTISDVHNPDKERVRKKDKHWEITAATPPLIKHEPAKLISLEESIQRQEQYLAKLKVLQEEQAIERLIAKKERLRKYKIQMPQMPMDLNMNTAFTTYRSNVNHIEGLKDYTEVDEVHDPLDEENSSPGINYTVYE